MSKRFNFLLPSPSVKQRARQRAPETIPLNMEPESGLYIKGPVVVMDFQSLYPSIMIAYNYCYSTLVGRINQLMLGYVQTNSNNFICRCFHKINTCIILIIHSND